MTKFGSAQGLKRVEDFRLITGGGRYTDDIVLPRQAYGFLLRSPHPAATITAIDTADAKAARGVIAVYTAADVDAAGIGELGCAVPIKNRDGTSRADPKRPVLARGRVRHVGDPVAFVVAETLAAARDAAERISVDYDTRPAVADMREAQQPGAPLVWDDAPGNLVFDWEVGNKAKMEKEFAEAAKVVSIEVENNRIVVASMEGRACNAAFDAESGRFTIHAGTQGVHGLRNHLSGALKVPATDIHVVTPDVGGGFGMKLFPYAEYILCAFAARALGRPVKWTADRSEAFLSDTQGRAQIMRARLALDARNNFLALDVHNTADMGAYLSTYSVFIPTMAGTKVLPSVYRWKAVYARVEGVFTNTVHTDAYRGAGRPESNYLVERLIDKAAAELGVDRITLRRKNMIKASQFPYRAALGSIYDSGDFPGTMALALEAADWAGAAQRKREAKKRGKRRGIGIGYYLEATGGNPSERAEIKFATDGMVEILVGTQSTGQGHETAYTQLVMDRLGIPLERIRVVQGDSDTIKSGGGTGGARSLYSEGSAIMAAADVVEKKGKDAAAEELEAAAADIEFADGRFSIVGTDRAITLIDLADALRAKGTDPAEVLDGVAEFQLAAHTFPNGCHVAEVELDPATGVVDVVRYVVADDMGKVVNPTIVAGQIHGGVAQGIGQALAERTVYDAEGQLLSASFMDYQLPRAGDLPDIAVVLNQDAPCKSNPLGVKGAGEAGSVGSCPAVMNALADALAEFGASVEMPATPERVWKALHATRMAAE
jgi:carbon-monoxide dehydrogenase large subunit